MPGFEDRPPVGPRRTKSLPSKYMIPSENMGEYDNGDPNRRRSAPPQSKPPGGGLYPLDEEGSYGEAPRQPGIPRPKPQYEARERKPKVYSSYAVDSECETHGKKLAKEEYQNYERKASMDRKYSGSRPVSRTPSRAGSRPVSRANSVSGRDSVAGSPAPSRRSFSGYNSAPRSRNSSIGRSSRSPDPQQNGDVVISGGQPYRKKSSKGNVYPAAPKKSSQSWQASLRSSSSTETSSNVRRRSSIRRDSTASIQKDEGEYNCDENNQNYLMSLDEFRKTSSISNGYTSSSSTKNYSSSSYTQSYQNGNMGGNSDSAVSLNGLRKPKIDSWDSMGILGLTTKIWNDTQKRQETFLESTGRILREETSSYIM